MVDTPQSALFEDAVGVCGECTVAEIEQLDCRAQFILPIKVNYIDV